MKRWLVQTTGKASKATIVDAADKHTALEKVAAMPEFAGLPLTARLSAGQPTPPRIRRGKKPSADPTTE
jgi:hypothetical protein